MNYIKKLNPQLSIKELDDMREEIESVYFISAKSLGIDIDSKVCIINLKTQDNLKSICKDLDIEWHESAKGIRFGRKQ